MSKTVARFTSDTNFAHFCDSAGYRHPGNMMYMDSTNLSVEFEGPVDYQLLTLAKQLGGEIEE